MPALFILPLVVLPCLGVLVFCAVTWWRFWRVVDAAHLDHLHRLSQGHVFSLGAAAFASSLVVQAAAVALYPVFLLQRLWLRSPEADPGPQAGPPVLFVHGYMHTASAWLPFSTWFHAAGYRDLHALTYHSLRDDFAAIVARVEAEVRRLDAARPGRGVVLVGHSLGGLAIRQFLNTSPLAGRVSAAATLGAPHQGSALAGLALNPLGRSLAFRGPLIQAVEAADRPPQTPCLSLASPMDNIVLPRQGLRIQAPGWQERETAPVCHLGMVFHRPTARIVLDFLEESLRGRAPRG
jgi:triacylglycerol esterase/lipase EstA (alpha/beta hydrolase family)